MAKRTAELAELDLPELVERLAEAKDTHFKLRIRNATGQLDNTAELQRVRREIARINTFLRQREIAAAEEPAGAPGRAGAAGKAEGKAS